MGECPAGGGVGIADDAEVGEGLKLGDELFSRKSVERGLQRSGMGQRQMVDLSVPVRDQPRRPRNPSVVRPA